MEPSSKCPILKETLRFMHVQEAALLNVWSYSSKKVRNQLGATSFFIGVSTNPKNLDGMTPLAVAMANDKQDCVKILAEIDEKQKVLLSSSPKILWKAVRSIPYFHSNILFIGRSDCP